MRHLNDQPPSHFVPGRRKPRLETTDAEPPALTDRDVLQAIADEADLIGRTYWGECYVLVKIPDQVLTFLAELDAGSADLEPEAPEGGADDGNDPDREPDDEDGDAEDEILANSLSGRLSARRRRARVTPPFAEDDEPQSDEGGTRPDRVLQAPQAFHDAVRLGDVEIANRIGAELVRSLSRKRR